MMAIYIIVIIIIVYESNLFSLFLSIMYILLPQDILRTDILFWLFIKSHHFRLWFEHVLILTEQAYFA